MPSTITILATAAAAVVASHHADHAHPVPQLGQVNFENSCNPIAKPVLDQALAWLHSFEYDEARRQFDSAAAADPACAIAYWGVAQSYYHPLWAPPGRLELEHGRQALELARKSNSTSPRERAYVEALASIYDNHSERDHKSRVLAYAAAMENLHRLYPDDTEAAVFYALALIAAGPLDDDPTYVREKSAAEILNRELASSPNHPGITHYLIHGYDYPVLASFALPAARRYASIAPASSHAQHMPSHIFGRLGLWEEMISSNRAAEAAALSYAASRNMPGAWDERLHAMDYLAYGYLQTGNDAAAKGVLDELYAIESVEPPNFKVAYAATALPARFALERKQWTEAANLSLSARTRGLVQWERFRWAGAQIHLARAIGAARTGQALLAREEVNKLVEIEGGLGSIPGEYDWKRQVSIQRQTAEAWALHAEGKTMEALASMRSAADIDDKSEKHPVTPGSVAPAREQLGELLLELDRPAEALQAFEMAIKQTPNRRIATEGIARSKSLVARASALQLPRP